MKDFNFYMRGTASVLIDGQYGSTGKGLLAAYLAKVSPSGGHVVHTTNASANAGHTTRWRDRIINSEIDRHIVTYHLPTGACVRKGNLAYINPGAIVNIPMLLEEKRTVESILGHGIHVMMHPHAASIEPEDREYEMEVGSQAEHISSTRKGVGRALARKVMREGRTVQSHADVLRAAGIQVSPLDLNQHLRHGTAVSIEVPQGISLGLNHGSFYPYCTSREVSVAQAMSDAGVHPRFLGMVAMSMRTYPIRVGSLDGQSSGPHFYDQREVSWEALGVKPEYTTVTHRKRRVFTWSRAQYRESLSKAMPSIVFLNFCNYYKERRQLEDQITSMVEDHSMIGVKPQLLFGFGPYIEDVIDNPSEALDRLPPF